MASVPPPTLYSVPDSPPPPAVAIRDLHFAYPDGTPALRGIDLTIMPGESVAIIGPNGAGKSTLLLHLNGILRGSGTVAIMGLPVDGGNLREIRRMVGVVFQDPEDQLFLTSVAQDVGFGPANLGLDRDEITLRVEEALAAVGMEGSEDRSSHHLSFGQKKRVAVATVLSMRPDVLVLDEPTSNLDPRSRRRLVDILRHQDATRIVVTHDLPLAYELCERAVILDEGRAVADRPTWQVLADTALLEAHGLELPYWFEAPGEASSVPAFRLAAPAARAGRSPT
jgi:cobalt/nickel transport system ATP-binding protein